MELYFLKIISRLILELERSDFFQIKAPGLKKANIFAKGKGGGGGFETLLAPSPLPPHGHAYE